MKGGTRDNLSVSSMTGSVVSFIFTLLLLLYLWNFFEIFIFKIIPTLFAKNSFLRRFVDRFNDPLLGEEGEISFRNLKEFLFLFHILIREIGHREFIR